MDDVATIRKIAAEFVCPLTQELPVNPVIASDGHVYEQSAFQQLVSVAKAENKPLRSPITKQKMRRRAYPVHSSKNVIGHVVKSGTLDESMCSNWKTHDLTYNVLETLKKKAQKDPRKYGKLGDAYYFGTVDGKLCDKNDTLAASAYSNRIQHVGTDVSSLRRLAICKAAKPEASKDDMDASLAMINTAFERVRDSKMLQKSRLHKRESDILAWMITSIMDVSYLTALSIPKVTRSPSVDQHVPDFTLYDKQRCEKWIERMKIYRKPPDDDSSSESSYDSENDSENDSDDDSDDDSNDSADDSDASWAS